MKSTKLLSRPLICMLCAMALAVAAPARAQFEIEPLDAIGSETPMPEDVLSTSAAFTAPDAQRKATLAITATIDDGWHIYSLTQKPGGPIASKIKLAPSNDFKILGEFKPSKAAERHNYPEIWPGITAEEHEGTVTWSAPIQFAEGVDPAKIEIGGSLYAQVCSSENSCLFPTDFKFTARMKGASAGDWGEKPASATTARKPRGVQRYKHDMSHVTLSGSIEPAVAAPGSTAKLTISAVPDDGYHIYPYAEKDPVEVSKPTLIVLHDASGFDHAKPEASAAPTEKPSELTKSGKEQYYEKPVSWTIELKIPEEAKPGSYPIEGIVGFQTCKATSCDPPRGAWFEGMLVVAEQSAAGGAQLLFRDGKYAEAAALARGETLSGADTTPTSVSTGDAEIIGTFKIRELNSGTSAAQSLSIVLVSAFIGGFILNFMPCVLPVIGLKILTFVEQSGHNRGQVFWLNLWYVLGLLSVFMVLAVFASAASLGLASENLAWGEQFNSTAFNIAMCAIVFAMALSFLGVWEIPIPGFAGTGKAASMANKEGVVGAFSKGVLSTVLATPCSGPFLGSVFGFTLTQPPEVTFALFGTIGLGMASPYLLIGAFPRLIRFLPKPGAWMDTFKHIMGFVLLGTVVFLFTFLNRDYLVATFALLIGIWAACWWIGQVPLTAEFDKKLLAWAQGIAAAALIGYASLNLLVEGKALLPWEPFTPQALAKHRAEGKTVMLDFTATWCLTCKTNLKFAINTNDVLRVVEKNNVVPMLADFSDVENSPEVKDMLRALKANSIPVLAIFPADRSDEVLLLRDLVTKAEVVSALREAGPSKNSSAQSEVALNE